MSDDKSSMSDSDVLFSVTITVICRAHKALS